MLVKGAPGGRILYFEDQNNSIHFFVDTTNAYLCHVNVIARFEMFEDQNMDLGTRLFDPKINHETLMINRGSSIIVQ